MGVREGLQRLIDKKEAEIERLEQEIRDARVYVQAIQDSFKLLPKEQPLDSITPRELRPGSIVSQVQKFLEQSGKPQHISAILTFLGKTQDKKNRVSLSGSLGGYVKDGRIFTRPAPNTFGLIEFGDQEDSPSALDQLPVNFGQ